MKLVVKTICLLLLLFAINDKIPFQKIEINPISIDSPIVLHETYWADSVLEELSLEEKIAQLLMISVNVNGSKKYISSIKKTIEKYQVGGVVFMESSPIKQVNLTNKLQQLVNVPLMIALDAEWGLGMRLDSVISYPKAMTLGATVNDQLSYDLGNYTGSQLRSIGVHINFAPVVDVNNNYNNPVINVRSFGEDKRNVSRKGLAVTLGLQSNHVLAVAKHFPGHGDTSLDSHMELPVIKHSATRINELELIPFKNLIKNGVGGVMVGHLAVPSLGDFDTPASLSSIIIDTVLRKQLGFKGLVFSDALNMRAVTNLKGSKNVALRALLAGNDVLVMPSNVDFAIKSILMAVKDGVIAESNINERCLKVLKAKQWFGLNRYTPFDSERLIEHLKKPKYQKLTANIVEQSLTLIKNSNQLIPFKQLNEKRLLIVAIGSGNSFDFNKIASRYCAVDTLSLNLTLNEEKRKFILDKINKYTHVIISHNGITNNPKSNFGILTTEHELIHDIAQIKPTVLCFTGNPYGLNIYNNLDAFESILITYSNTQLVQQKSAQAIFGGIPIQGKLPVSISDNYSAGHGIVINSSSRIAFNEPYEFNLDDSAFYKADSIILDAIEMKATPGCQVLFAKDGKVVYNKTFGHFTYSKNREVLETDLYDLASVTKLTATTISLMKLFEDNKLDLTAKASVYLPEFKVRDKKTVRINQMLAHHSGMRSWIPFYRSTLTIEKKLEPRIYSTEPSDSFKLKVADNIFIRNDYVDSVYAAIIDTPAYHKKKYRYSDLAFYYLPKLIERQSGMSIDEFTAIHYFSKLGMNNTLYNPLDSFIKESIVPSENDKIYRNQIIQGYVNDPGAAMLGGISGHAGLFSTAIDLVKLGQLLLNEGEYGGEHYFKPNTLNVFNKAYFIRKGNRRALGFDKPALKHGDPGPTCESASQLSFGHSGFTGTYFWVDPEHQSVYIFLSNRTFPDQNNSKLVKNDIRTKIQQVFYDVFEQ